MSAINVPENKRNTKISLVHKHGSGIIKSIDQGSEINCSVNTIKLIDNHFDKYDLIKHREYKKIIHTAKVQVCCTLF